MTHGFDERDLVLCYPRGHACVIASFHQSAGSSDFHMFHARCT